MAAITIRLENEAEVVHRYDAEVLLPGPLHTLLSDAIHIGQRAARGEIKSDTGALMGSLTVQVQPTLARLYTNSPYGAPVDQGRRAGARQPPTRPIAAWLSRHGGDPAMAFVVARSIARRGIRGRFFMRAALRAIENAMPRLMEQAGREIDAIWGR